MTLTTLASGSSGNCILLSSGATHILIDAGISARRISRALAGLDLAVDDLSAIFVTHEHSDHICGLNTLMKHHAIPVCTAAPTGRQLAYRIAFLEPHLQAVEPGVPVAVGELEITPFPTLHDAASPMGYAVTDGRHKAAVVTDLGVVTDDVYDAVRGAHLLVAESNHDVERLRSGSYPYPLKARILGDHGHLSNDACAVLCADAVDWGCTRVVLAHLSKENNTPQLAVSAVAPVLRGAAQLTVAPRDEAGPTYAVAG